MSNRPLDPDIDEPDPYFDGLDDLDDDFDDDWEDDEDEDDDRTVYDEDEDDSKKAADVPPEFVEQQQKMKDKAKVDALWPSTRSVE